MERTISWSVYGAAFVLSIVMFIIGIYVGHVIDLSSQNAISTSITDLSQKMSTVQLIMLADSNATSFCPLYLSQLKSIDSDIEKVGYQLSYFEDIKKVTDNELKKQYFILEAQSYLLSKKVKSLCNDRSVLLVNFYSNSNCANCKAQGEQILQARDELLGKNIKVKLFSFDGDLGSPVADALKTQYGITKYPSIVINDSVYSGYHDKSALEKLIVDAK